MGVGPDLDGDQDGGSSHEHRTEGPVEKDHHVAARNLHGTSEVFLQHRAQNKAQNDRRDMEVEN